MKVAREPLLDAIESRLTVGMGAHAARMVNGPRMVLGTPVACELVLVDRLPSRLPILQRTTGLDPMGPVFVPLAVPDTALLPVRPSNVSDPLHVPLAHSEQ